MRFFNSQNKQSNSGFELLNTQITTLHDLIVQAMQKKEEEKRIAEEQAAKERYWKIPNCVMMNDDNYNTTGRSSHRVISTDEPCLDYFLGQGLKSSDLLVIHGQRPTTPSIRKLGFLATANAIIDYRKSKIAIGEGVTSTDGIGAQPPYYAKKDFANYHLPGEWEIARDAELNPFKDVLVFKRMVEFLGVIPINLKGNMWESEDLIENRIDCNKPPKRGDGARHAKIRLIDPDGEEFTKTFQSIPTTRNLSEKENPSEIIDLDHFHDS
ncbi:hypothetical protein Tco_1516120 [Tanacetum coccineum]